MDTNNRCFTCDAGHDSCRDSLGAWIFFILGIVAALAIRVVTLLIHIDPLYAQIAWYIGVGGFLVFFIYKFRLAQKRAQEITRQDLIKKINCHLPLQDRDYSLIGAILCGYSSKKERINYFCIFGLSALALILAVYFDFFK
ncbi:MAG: hypothetical protein JXD21_03970 [Candidatus Omnitrophica bacterium]|nr:hypothetical protein [Candidatus Omnitrophota bacterium]